MMLFVRGRKIPVMVWIYGGGYMLETGEMYPGYGLAVHGDIIVVNFIYRTSSLGWLSTGELIHWIYNKPIQLSINPHFLKIG